MPPRPTPVINNRRARHDYLVLDTYECGLVLKGAEVKSIREGKANLREAFADDVNRFPETNESNNKRSMTFTVGGGGCPSGGLATPSDRWKLEIFNNRSLAGAAVEHVVAAPAASR